MTDYHDILSQYGKHLPEKDKDFARSIWLATRNGNGSEKQRHWLEVMALKAQEAAAPQPAGMDGQFADLAGRIAHSNEKRTGDGKRPGKIICKGVKLYTAGQRSRYYGQTMVVSDGGDGYYGRIDVDGTFYSAPACTDDVFDTLRHLNADPASAAQQHGAATGSCCFCNRELTDDRPGHSIERGYGPVCAAYNNLPWGAKDEEAVA